MPQFIVRALHRKLALLGFVAALAFTATSSPALADGAGQDSSAIADETNAALLNAGKEADAALNGLMAARLAQSPAQATFTPDHAPLSKVPPALAKAISLNWNGSFEKLAAKISDAVGYMMVVKGKAPVRPVVVTVVSAGRTFILE